jgi:hypothetical protein
MRRVNRLRSSEFLFRWDAPPDRPHDPPDEKVIAAIKWSIEAATREAHHLGAIVIVPNSYQDAVALLFAKAVSHTMALITLAERQYGIEACVIARALVELYVDLVVLGTGDRENNAEKFFEYAWVLAHKDLVRMRDLHAKGLVERDWLLEYEKTADLVEKEYGRVKDRFTFTDRNGKPRVADHWSGPSTVTSRASKVLVGIEYGFFERSYRRLSEVLHPVGREALRYKRFGTGTDPNAYVAGPTPTETSRPLITGLRYFLKAFEVFGSTFGFSVTSYTETANGMLKVSSAAS